MSLTYLQKTGQQDFSGLKNLFERASTAVANSDVLNRARESTSAAGSNIASWYKGLPEETRQTLTRGAIGAAAGGTALGLLRHSSPGDPYEREHKGTGKAVALGALLGGGGAAALPLGAKLLAGGIKFPHEREKKLLPRLSDGLLNTGAAVALPGIAAGATGKKLLGNRLPTQGNLTSALGALKKLQGVDTTDPIAQLTNLRKMKFLDRLTKLDDLAGGGRAYQDAMSLGGLKPHLGRLGRYGALGAIPLAGLTAYGLQKEVTG